MKLDAGYGQHFKAEGNPSTTLQLLPQFYSQSSKHNIYFKMSAPSSSRQSRIPFTLQAVFLASNRGNEVHKPPPEKVANKVFFRNWLFQRQSNSGTKRSLFSLMRRDVQQTEVKQTSPAGRRSSSGSSNVSYSKLPQ